MNQATRDAVREGAKRSASIILPLVFDTLGVPAAMLDVGGGEGHWIEAARDLGVTELWNADVISHEAVRWDAEAFQSLPVRFADGHVAKPWPLALCLEVAEHLSPMAGDHLVAELCRVSTEIIWSAAIPGQGGDGHINEQWPAYWTERFWQHGYALTDPFRDTLWGDVRVEPWYRQNLLLAVPIHTLESGEHSVRCLVDPVTWAHHRGVPAPGI